MHRLDRIVVVIVVVVIVIDGAEWKFNRTWLGWILHLAVWQWCNSSVFVHIEWHSKNKMTTTVRRTKSNRTDPSYFAYGYIHRVHVSMHFTEHANASRMCFWFTNKLASQIYVYTWCIYLVVRMVIVLIHRLRSFCMWARQTTNECESHKLSIPPNKTY